MASFHQAVRLRCVLTCCWLVALAVLAGPAEARAAGRAPWVPADDYVIDVWETDQGLPENSATAMVQTPDGHLWIGTFNGLVRFDGVRFTVFDSTNMPGLPSPAIVNLHVDRRERLWISTDRGLVVVDHGRFTTFGAESGWVGDYVRQFVELESGDLFVVTFDRHLLRFDGKGFGEVAFPASVDQRERPGSLTLAQGRAVLADPAFVGHWNGEAWVSSAAGADPDIRGAGVGRDGRGWILTREFLKSTTPDGAAPRRLTAPVGAFWALYEDSRGNVWVCSFESGLYRVAPDGTVSHLSTANGLSYDSVRFVYEDRESNLWVGTSGGGLLRLKPRLFSNWGLAEGLPERVVKSVAVTADGRLLAGTHGRGVVAVDGTTVFSLPDRSSYVQTTLVDRRKQLWVGLHQDGAYRAELGHAADPVVPDALRDERGGWGVYALFEDSRGRVWAAGERGAEVHDGAATTILKLPRGVSIRTIAEDPVRGVIYVGTASAGLLKLAGGSLVPVPEAHALEGVGIASLHADADGTLWIGTFDRGLAVLARGTLTRIGEAEGVRARGIGAIIDDARGFLWFGTNHGVLRVARRQLQALLGGRAARVHATVFDLDDGLASIECPVGYQPTAVTGPDGHLWFATLKGVARIDPTRVRPLAVSPRIVVDEVQVDERLVAGARLQPFDWSGTAVAVVPAGSRRVEVHYTALSLLAPEKTRFRYRLVGHDADWIDAGTRRVAYLNDLAPGDYRLEVHAITNAGGASQSPGVVTFTVLPFWWQMTWVQGLAVTLFIGAVGLAGWMASHLTLGRQLERQSHQRALDRERARLATVLDATTDCVAFAAPDGRLIYLNPAGHRILGLSDEASISDLTLADLHPSSARARIDAEAIPAAIKDGVWSGETTIARAGGGEVPVSQVIAAHRSASGQVEFLSTIIRDLTERVKAERRLRASEEQLRQSQKMEAVGRLAGGIAHDFNNLLTVITGYTELLLERHPPDDPDHAPIDEMHRASLRAADLTQQLLAFSRKQVLSLAAVDLNDVIEGLERMLRPLIGEHIMLATRLTPDLPPVRADRGQLEQVIVNLAVNARDAMPDGGLLTVRTFKVTADAADELAPELGPGDYICLDVSDTGTGMADAVRDHIFEPFFTTKGAGRGTGLGLSTVYGIVRQSGGAIGVDTAPGKGTTFHVYLPQSAAAVEPPRVDRHRAPMGHEVILLVEDEDSVRRVTRTVLERHGYTVLAAVDGPDALSVARAYAGRIHAVLTDVVMPNMNGRELSELLRRARPGLKVLYMSGYTDDAILRHGVLDKGVAFLQKPFTPDVLARKLRDVLDLPSAPGLGNDALD
jgi:PAS domain S-box-containing protein